LELPADGKAQEVSSSTVNRLWQLHNIKPHLSRTFKLSRDPKFLEKLTDVVGLYLNPPQKALVLCLDEKSQIQALDRTQPGLPLKKGRCGTMTHDYKRNGTTTLFAALNVLEGKVIGQCHPRHRHQEWLKFLRDWIASFPMNSRCTWLWTTTDTQRAERASLVEEASTLCLSLHSTSSSWLNLVSVGSRNSARRPFAVARLSVCRICSGPLMNSWRHGTRVPIRLFGRRQWKTS